MQCPDPELLFDYVNDETIGEHIETEIQQHLVSCDSCTQEYNSHRATKRILTEYWDGKIESCFDTDTLSEYLVDDYERRHKPSPHQLATGVSFVKKQMGYGSATHPVVKGSTLRWTKRWERWYSP